MSDEEAAAGYHAGLEEGRAATIDRLRSADDALMEAISARIGTEMFPCSPLEWDRWRARCRIIGDALASIVRQTGGFEAGGYFWSVLTPGPQDASFRGRADSLEEAKREFKAAWLRLPTVVQEPPCPSSSAPTATPPDPAKPT